MLTIPASPSEKVLPTILPPLIRFILLLTKISIFPPLPLEPGSTSLEISVSEMLFLPSRVRFSAWMITDPALPFEKVSLLIFPPLTRSMAFVTTISMFPASPVFVPASVEFVSLVINVLLTSKESAFNTIPSLFSGVRLPKLLANNLLSIIDTSPPWMTICPTPLPLVSIRLVSIRTSPVVFPSGSEANDTW